MKFLFWLLLLVNLGALAYFKLGLHAPVPTLAAKPDMLPEKMQLLTPQQVQAMPKRQTDALMPVPAPTTPNLSGQPVACYEWGIFEPSKLNDVLTVVNAMSIKSNVVQQSSQESVRYWVYRPPLPTAEATQERAEELKALGIADFFIVQEPKWRNAISFGVFKDEKLATRLVQELQRKGVREVVKSVRNKGNGHSSLILEGITPTLLEQLKKNQPDFPGTAIKDATCPVA